MAKYKIGDKVRVKSDLISGDRYGYMYFTEDMKDACGTVLTIETVNPCSYGVKEDYPSYWTDEMFEGLAEEEPKPTPTPVVNVNVTVNLYENACWYCRKGGLVDLYLAGAMGICPSCGRVCNNTTPTLKKESIVIEFKPSKPKENKPLTTEELKALPNGAKVFLVFNKYEDDEYIDEPDWLTSMTCWRTKKGDQLVRDGGFSWIDENDDGCFKCYLEEPENERPF